MFYNCISLDSINLDKFGTGELNIDLSYMFYNCHSLTSIKFNSSSLVVKDMKYMFYNCSKISNIILQAFGSIPSSNFNMSYPFYNCLSLNSIDIKEYYFSVTDTREMFYNCMNLTSISFHLKATNNSINMSKMFYNCKNLEIIFL